MLGGGRPWEPAWRRTDAYRLPRELRPSLTSELRAGLLGKGEEVLSQVGQRGFLQEGSREELLWSDGKKQLVRTRVVKGRKVS